MQCIKNRLTLILLFLTLIWIKWVPGDPNIIFKNGHQKYTAWAPGDPMPSCFYNVMSLFEETNKFSEPNT